MYQMHQELQTIQAEKDPLQKLAKQWALKTRVLCFDEFFVSDIGDAMLLGGLMTHLFQQGVVLVATSNLAPDDLYYNGLQRANFLPAIAQIKQHCQVLHLEDGQDYRLRELEQAKLYYTPIVESLTQELQQRFRAFVGDHAPINREPIEVNHRRLPVILESHGVLWASFEQLCQSARSCADYVELARCYHTVFVSDVVVMDT